MTRPDKESARWAAPSASPMADFSAFLFAQICEEKNGMTLSVVSALARLGVDPWQEAARLQALPRTAAALTLAGMIGRMSSNSALIADAPGVAARLIKLLPKSAAPAGGPPPDVSVPRDRFLSLRRQRHGRLMLWQIGVIVVLGAFVIFGMVTGHSGTATDDGGPASVTSSR